MNDLNLQQKPRRGRPKIRPGASDITIKKIPPAVHQALQQYAADNCISQSNALIRLLATALGVEM